MLVLSRQRDEETVYDFSEATDEDIARLRSGEIHLVATIVDIRGDKVRIGHLAPKSIGVHRREVYDARQKQKKAAAAGETAGTHTTPPATGEGAADGR